MLVYLLSIGFLISLSIPSTAAPHTVHGVRFGWHGTYARVVFDVEGEIPYQIVATEEPTKIVVTFPGLSQAPKPGVWRTSAAVIEEVRFVGTAGEVSAEIQLTRHGTVRKHYRMNSPPRIVIDIVTLPDGAPDRKVRAGRPAAKGPERGISALTARQIPAAATISPAAQEGKEQRLPPAIEGQSLPPEGKEQRLLQETQGQFSPQTAGPRVVPLLPPVSESLTATLSESELLSVAERHWQQGKFLAAQRAYKTFLERFPAYSHNHLIAVRLADILQNQQQYREALEAYAQVMTSYPGSEGAIISEMRMAELGIQIPDLLPQHQDVRFTAYHAPVASLHTLIQTYPQSPLADVARFKVGVIQLQRHEAHAALAAFQELLNKPLKEELRREVQAKYREALQAVMSAWQEQGQHVEVLRTFFMHKGQLSPQEAESSDFLLPVAISYARLGLLPEAQSLFQVQIQATPPPQRGPLAFEQADVLATRGLLQEAKTLLKDTAPHAEEATRKQILMALGKLTLRMGQPEEAVQYLRLGEGIITSAAARASLLALLGAGYLAQDRHKEGLQVFQQCVEIATADAQAPLPSAETCLFRVAEILFAQRQYQQALPVYEKLLAVFPQTYYRQRALLHMAAISRALTNLEQMQHILETLRDTSTDPLWQKVAIDTLEEAAWQRQFHERLAEFQNHLMR
jgi:tetratricopeptide (TPR) repeat protein